VNEVRAEVVVGQPPAEAFRLFTVEIDRWWRRGERYGGTEVRGHHFEPYVGGRFLEILDEREGVLGVITVWDPPTRLSFTWRQGNWKPEETTEVEVTFSEVADGTRVVLRHIGFDSVSSDIGCEVGYAHGWDELLGWFQEASTPNPSAARRE
jgi:uncharacterized protein YndB with AHSA1/START domain